jgi:hypothetical protein
MRSIMFLAAGLCLAILVGCGANSPIAPTEKTGQATFTIGQNYGGGIIFYIDGTGQHGLIAATSDAIFKMQWWGDRYYPLIGTTGAAIGTGASNTQAIIAKQGMSNQYAALTCKNYHGGGYSDWFLPSKDELYQLWAHKSAVGGFTWGAYWSSTEYVTQFDHTCAWTKIFYNPTEQITHRDRVNGVRAIRAF